MMKAKISNGEEEKEKVQYACTGNGIIRPGPGTKKVEEGESGSVCYNNEPGLDSNTFFTFRQSS